DAPVLLEQGAGGRRRLARGDTVCRWSGGDTDGGVCRTRAGHFWPGGCADGHRFAGARGAAAAPAEQFRGNGRTAAIADGGGDGGGGDGRHVAAAAAVPAENPRPQQADAGPTRG